ncbi:MAG: hypothetical protein JSV15_03585 [Candidatus Bathyarchaeota archaeon]|nr:MAG: hypothetical protein JSV15_03585 [Candidatus Bathyarchaeota archaeon]
MSNSTQGCNITGESNELDKAVNILRVAAEGIKKTEIMYRCNLDHMILNNYLYALMEMKLLKVEEASETFYQTTEKGLQLLHIYHKLKWLLWGKTFDFLLVRLLNRLLLNKRLPHERLMPVEDTNE